MRKVKYHKNYRILLINLKTKLLTLLTVCLIASIVISTSAALVSAAQKTPQQKQEQAQKQYSGFTLTATGQAKNAEGQNVDVELYLEGKANGKLKTVFHLHTQGGDITITGYEGIIATKGQGIIVNKNNFIHLNIMMSQTYYGGRSTIWVLRGETGELTDDTLPIISLESRRVVLPLEDYPQLTELKLTSGTITFLD